jgi:hypothetical protein
MYSIIIELFTVHMIRKNMVTVHPLHANYFVFRKYIDHIFLSHPFMF